MCQACLEAELWLAYQEELAARQAAAAPAEPKAASNAQPAPERPGFSFACEETSDG